MFGRGGPTPVEAGAEAVGSFPDPDLDASSGVFLGSLRSEFDEPDAVPEPFERLAAVAEGVLAAYRRHLLTAEQAAERLQVLRLCDGDGIEWTLGPTSMRWYRRLPGGTWKVAALPTGEDAALVASAGVAVARIAQLPLPGKAGSAPAPAPDPAPTAVPTSVPVSESAAAPVEAAADAAAAAARPVPSRQVSPRPVPVADPATDATHAADAPQPDPTSAPADADAGGYGTYPTTSRPVLPTLSAVPVAPVEDGYGYGTDTVPGAWPVGQDAAPAWAPPPRATVAPYPATRPGPGDPTGPEAGSDPGQPGDLEEDANAAELREMLAALVQDTGITLSGLDRGTDA